MQEITVHIGTLYLDLFIGEAQSLKDKRMVLKRLKDQIRSKFNVSIAELAGQDKWQIATIGVAMMGADKKYIDKILQHVLSHIENFHAVEISGSQLEFI